MAKISVTDCPAGPALDAAVAKVLGNKIALDKQGQPYHEHLILAGVIIKYVDRYSTDMTVAWELWCATGGEKRLHEYSDGSCTCFLGGMSFGGSSDYADGVYASADKASLAITRAFLLAHGVTEVEVTDD
jgi:hypothetical protein